MTWPGPSLRTCLLALAIVAATGCSHPSVITQGQAETQIEGGVALNTTTATYHLAHVRLTLDKVVSLPDGMLGLRFSFGSRSPDCCSLFPRAALTNDTGDVQTRTTEVVVPMSDIGPDGVLPMHLWLRGTTHKPSF